MEKDLFEFIDFSEVDALYTGVKGKGVPACFRPIDLLVLVFAVL